MHKKNKAFTLTELLVVVIVLGVLAAVAVPKFTRVLETRKTTEAEDIFAAVRTEQENRCVFGKKYLTDKKQLTMLAGADNSANYTYSLTNQGITAASSKGYQLKMLSYKDGQICCEGEYCGSLNKSYPSCSALSVASDECAGEVTEDHKMCSPSSKPTSSESCNGCGTRTRSVTCNTSTGSWEAGLWGECSKTAEECNPCPDGYTYNADLNECVPDEEPCPDGLQYDPETGDCKSFCELDEEFDLPLISITQEDCEKLEKNCGNITVKGVWEQSVGEGDCGNCTFPECPKYYMDCVAQSGLAGNYYPSMSDAFTACANGDINAVYNASGTDSSRIIGESRKHHGVYTQISFTGSPSYIHCECKAVQY